MASPTFTLRRKDPINVTPPGTQGKPEDFSHLLIIYLIKKIVSLGKLTSGYKQGLENSAKTHAPPVATSGHMEDSKDTPGCGCSAAGMLLSATQRTPPLAVGSSGC